MANTIQIGNSFCRLVGCSEKLADEVRELLSYDDQEAIHEAENLKQQIKIARYQRNGRKAGFLTQKLKAAEAAIHVCLLKDDRFPSGLLKLVSEALGEARIKFNLEDIREKPKNTIDYPWKAQFDGRYYQNEVNDLAVAEGRGVIESAVGTGKSFMMAMIIKNLGVRCLIVAPSSDLKVQLLDGMEELFTGRYVAEMTTAKIKRATPIREPIQVVTIHTLASLRKQGLVDKALEGVQMICIDEVHHAGAATYTDLLPHFDHIYHRFGFTGTFMRNDSKTLNMWGFLSTVLYTYTAGQAVEEGFLTPLKVLVHDIEGRKKQKYLSEYKANYCGGKALMLKIEDILNTYVESGQQVLILVKQKDQAGKLIHEYLDDCGIENTYISGDDKKDVIKQALKDFNEKKVKVLIGSSIIGEGIDIRSTDHLIMAQGGKSEIAITQATGRAVRLFEGKEVAWLHDFNMQDTKYMQKHLLERIGIYERNFNAEIEVI